MPASIGLVLGALDVVRWVGGVHSWQLNAVGALVCVSNVAFCVAYGLHIVDEVYGDKIVKHSTRQSWDNPLSGKPRAARAVLSLLITTNAFAMLYPPLMGCAFACMYAYVRHASSFNRTLLDHGFTRLMLFANAVLCCGDFAAHFKPRVVSLLPVMRRMEVREGVLRHKKAQRGGARCRLLQDQREDRLLVQGRPALFHVYLTAGTAKLCSPGERWLSGSALAVTLLTFWSSLPARYVVPPFLSELGSYMTLVVELVLPFVAIAGSLAARRLAVVAFATFHVGIGVCMAPVWYFQVATFPFVAAFAVTQHPTTDAAHSPLLALFLVAQLGNIVHTRSQLAYVRQLFLSPISFLRLDDNNLYRMFADGWTIVSLRAQFQLTMVDGSVQLLPPLLDTDYPNASNYRVVQSLYMKVTNTEAPFFDHVLEDIREKYPGCAKIESVCVAQHVNEDKIASFSLGGAATKDCYTEGRVSEVLWSKK